MARFDAWEAEGRIVGGRDSPGFLLVDPELWQQWPRNYKVMWMTLAAWWATARYSDGEPIDWLRVGSLDDGSVLGRGGYRLKVRPVIEQ